MDFKDFLKKNKLDDNNTLDTLDTLDNNLDNTIQVQMNFTEFKKGDFIKIIYLQDSPLNYYKGYFGEIKSYIKNAKNAYILLDAINSNRELEFPITHLIKRKI